jgi:hypothetical protein
MTRGRGKKINQVKNAGNARDFAAGKKLGRPKQIWIVDNPAGDAFGTTGHWEKVKRATI